MTLMAAAFGGERGLPAQFGIGNFGKINERVYRGAQPDAMGILSLKRMGVKTIVNLRMTNDVWNGESSAARTNGMLYVNVPMSGLGRPEDEQVRKALAILNTSPGPIFIHCQHGCDRTGTIIACYRIQHDLWASQAALREADLYGLSNWERGMRDFILNFGRPQK